MASQSFSFEMQTVTSTEQKPEKIENINFGELVNALTKRGYSNETDGVVTVKGKQGKINTLKINIVDEVQ